MSLISLLIALAAERYLSSSAWQFNRYYCQYQRFFTRLSLAKYIKNNVVLTALFILIPILVCYGLLSLVSDGLLHMLFSTIILVVCFGCMTSRDRYKQYLIAAFRGEETTREMHHKQLLQDKSLPDIGFGQALIWLNYRYFIAIMLFFVLFGATGALLYRLLTKVNEEANAEHNAQDNCCASENEHQLVSKLLFYCDWLPVRIVSFGYMLVGHFSRALPTWLDNLFNLTKTPSQLLIDVAEKSEDFMVDKQDCTAEPCLLVRLAKRTLLLCLATIALLILTGVID